MTEQLVLALDQGTTSSRAIVIDGAGRIRGSASEELPQVYPAPGEVEHDPEAIWTTQLDTARRALADAGVDAASVAAIGLTNQRETTIVWDRATGRPVANAIVWQSRVTAPRCDALRAAGHEALFRERTGLPIDAYFSGPKIAEILDRGPRLRARAERGELAFGTVDAFLIWRLTGGRVHATDVSNASRTLPKGRLGERARCLPPPPASRSGAPTRADPDTITVLVVDDHPGFRRAIERALRRSPGLTLVGSARNGEEAIVDERSARAACGRHGSGHARRVRRRGDARADVPARGPRPS